jgi:predicted LPLAT superfamily acyltransferase
MKFCILIPIFNHSNTITELIKALEPLHIKIIIVDDGSNIETKKALDKLKSDFHSIYIHKQYINHGKGEAIFTGFSIASSLGYTHAIQIDADLQHDINDIPKFIKEAQKHPRNIISGMPIYDSSIPKSRLHGRKITNFWVAIETWSKDLKESMCGYRVYPIKECLDLLTTESIGRRMQFDIEILVKLYWNDIKTIYIPTKVTYPKSGISHFKMIRDNIRISWMHTRLFFGMIKKIPTIIKNKHKHRSENHWSNITEKGSYLGLSIVTFIYRFAGRRLTKLLIYPIITYFYILGRNPRKWSKKYLSKIETISNQKNSSLKHFIVFGESAFDKLSVWCNDITLDQITFPNRQLFLDNIDAKKGGVILTAHLGNIEIARALGMLTTSVKINAIVFNEHAKKFNTALEKIHPSFNLNLISVAHIDLTLAMTLKDKVDQGEFIIIVGDRTSTTQPGRSTSAIFLDENANFPQGPFILASLLQAPTYFMLCLKEEKNRYHFVFELFAEQLTLKKKGREEQLQIYVQKYAKLLEHYCIKYPLQWFNYFDFWQNKHD